MKRRGGALVAAIIGSLLLAACGVPVDSSAKPLPDGVLPTLSPTATPTPTQTTSPEPIPETARLWFVRDEGVVPVTAAVAGSDPQQLLDALASPPVSAREVRSLMIDPLTAQALVRVAVDAPPLPRIVTVEADAAFTALPPNEQVLLLGQVVLTLTGTRATDGVAVVNEQGESLAIPLPDGRLLDGPATASDYRSLVLSSAAA